MSNITMVPVFGTSFQVYVPIFMVIVAIFTMFNLFTRILAIFGVESDEPTSGFCCFRFSRQGHTLLSEEDMERYETGKKLIMNELRSPAILNAVTQPVTANSSISDKQGATGKQNNSAIEMSARTASVSKGSALSNSLYSKVTESDDSPPRESRNSRPAVKSTSKFGSRLAGEDDDEEVYDFSKYLRDDSQDDVESRGATASHNLKSAAGGPTTVSVSSTSWFSKLTMSGSGSDGENTRTKGIIAASSKSPLHTVLGTTTVTSQVNIQTKPADAELPSREVKHQSFFDMLDEELSDTGGGRYN
jgi:hypothetical protein